MRLPSHMRPAPGHRPEHGRRRSRSQAISPTGSKCLLGIKGVAARIRELEAQMSREEVALRIGDDFVAKKFGEKNNEEILDHAIRTAMALLTEGVVAAPTEGIAKIRLGKNDDGTQYLDDLLRRPIRSAGGTAQALSVLVGDYVRPETRDQPLLSPGRRRSSGTSRRSGSTTPS